MSNGLSEFVAITAPESYGSVLTASHYYLPILTKADAGDHVCMPTYNFELLTIPIPDVNGSVEHASSNRVAVWTNTDALTGLVCRLLRGSKKAPTDSPESE